MDDNIDIIQDLDKDLFDEPDMPKVYDDSGIFYDEPIPPAIAKDILGENFVEGHNYKLISMNEGLVLTRTDPDHPEDVFEYALDEEDPCLQSYADMMYAVNAQDPIPDTDVEDTERQTTSDIAFKIIVGLLIFMIIFGIGVIIFLLTL